MVKAKTRPGYQAVRVYVEGGGTYRADQTQLRESFTKLLGGVLGDLPKPKTITCGGRSNAFDDFRNALAANRDALCLLLVDSEGPVKLGESPWAHVRARTGDGWERPASVGDDQLHLMVETMETWIVSDLDALRRVYGPAVDAGSLPKENLEGVPRRDLLQKLSRALRDTRKEYTKSTGCLLIGQVDPRRLEASCPHAARFFEHLRQVCAALPRHGIDRRRGS